MLSASVIVVAAAFSRIEPLAAEVLYWLMIPPALLYWYTRSLIFAYFPGLSTDLQS